MPSVMELCSNAIRGVIVAPPGKKLVVADLANIEGRMAAWLAGEAWKLQAFLDYDAGTGPDLYKVAYAKAFNIRPEDVTKPQRQIGKVMELMLQYEGGVGAFLTGAAAYAIDLDAMAQAALPNIPDDVLERFVFAVDVGEEMLGALGQLDLGGEIDDRGRGGLDGGIFLGKQLEVLERVFLHDGRLMAPEKMAVGSPGG